MPLNPELAGYAHREWSVQLFSAPCEAPCSFAFGCFCPCCAIAKQRKDLLELTGEPYVCCGGIAKPCPCCDCGDEQPEVPCLCLEAFLCPQIALSANRYIMQTRFGLENTECDDCLFQVTGCLACLANAAQCIRCLRDCFQIDLPGDCDDCIANNADELTELANCVILSVSGCMFAQQNAEIHLIEESGYGGPAREIISALPPKQQAMIHKGMTSMELLPPGQNLM
eukprot:TRINITY_DN10442_c0_g3_i1.p1 TRINITY_DN10442_c0_g3~~TRINITY_DN10442_c0_g3_i1.p1  ORF type:complete len:248 (+),score=40.81 TRINITY_DN10442_c0_g3_i1:68-745(+)